MSAVTAVPLRPIARGSVLKLWIGLAVLTITALGLAWWGTRSLQRTVTSSGLQYQVIREGDGNLITGADVAAVNLVGRRENGEVFADTRRDRPLEVNPDNFIPGLGEGLKLMRKGATYRFWLPPSLYRGQIPPNLTTGPDERLVFDLQVLDVAPGMAQVQRMQELQRQMQGPGPGANPHAGAGTPPPGAGAEAPAGPPQSVPPAP